MYMIMKRELSLFISSLSTTTLSTSLELEDSQEGIPLEVLLAKYRRGICGEIEIVRLNLERGTSTFVLSGEGLKRFCKELQENRSV